MAAQGFREAKEAALAGFDDVGPGHLNCAQAVVCCALRTLGAGDHSVALARYFGGGMVRTGEVCGALSGAALSLGLRDECLGLSWPDGTSPDVERLQQLFRRFATEFGALTCRELVGYATDSSEGYDRFRADGKHASCESYVSWVCERLHGILETTG